MSQNRCFFLTYTSIMIYYSILHEKQKQRDLFQFSSLTGRSTLEHFYFFNLKNETKIIRSL